MIYIVHCNSRPEFIKIGHTQRNFRGRFNIMQVGCPFSLTALAIFPGDKIKEKELHEKLIRHHFRGEWFYYNDETLMLLGLKKDQWLRRKQFPSDNCESPVMPI